MNSTHTHRKKFPLGYLLHTYPDFYTGPADSYDNLLGRIVFFLQWVVSLNSAHLSHLKTGPSGLEIYWHPGRQLTLGWNEVLRLECRRIGPFSFETLFVDRSILTMMTNLIFLSEGDRRIFESRRLGIPLWTYRGWPAGDLADDLKRYVPQVVSRGD